MLRLRPAPNAPHIESNDSRGWFCGDDTAIGKFGRCASAGELQRCVRHLLGDVDVACGRSRVAGAARPRHLVGDGRLARHLCGAAVAALRGAPPVRRTRSGGERAPAGRDQCPDDGRQRAVGSNRRREFARSRSQIAARQRAAELRGTSLRARRARSRPWPIRAIRTRSISGRCRHPRWSCRKQVRRRSGPHRAAPSARSRRPSRK